MERSRSRLRIEGVKNTLRAHWAAYLIEAWGIGTFMFVAGIVAALLQLASGSLRMTLNDAPFFARTVFGVAMGTTSAAIVYSRWGAHSGAHLNPALTLSYAWLRKIGSWDAVFYVAAQFAGAALGFALAVRVAREPLMRAHDIVTIPGRTGPAAAFAAELAMTFVLMSAILFVSNGPPRVARFTGLVAACFVALYIAVEAPVSGMSLNPARTVASALAANEWTAIWIYLIAPPLGMLTAAAFYVRLPFVRPVGCAKLNHAPGPCIFSCNHAGARENERFATSSAVVTATRDC